MPASIQSAPRPAMAMPPSSPRLPRTMTQSAIPMTIQATKELNPEHAEPILTDCGPPGVAIVKTVASVGSIAAPSGRRCARRAVPQAVASVSGLRR